MSSSHGAQLTNTTSSERYFSYYFPELGLIWARHPVSQTCVTKFKKISLFVSRGSAIGVRPNNVVSIVRFKQGQEFFLFKMTRYLGPTQSPI